MPTFLFTTGSITFKVFTISDDSPFCNEYEPPLVYDTDDQVIAEAHYPFPPPLRHWLVLTEILGTLDLAMLTHGRRERQEGRTPFYCGWCRSSGTPVCGFIPNFAATAKILYLA